MRELTMLGSIGVVLGFGSAGLAQTAPPPIANPAAPAVAAFPADPGDSPSATAPAAPQRAAPANVAPPQPAPAAAPADDAFPTEVSRGESDSTVPEPISTPSAAPPGKFFLGLRLGYGLPMGEVESGDEMTETTAGQIPLGLDIGYMVSPHVMLGLYGQYGFGRIGGQLADLCDSADSQGVSCSLSDVRVGLQAQYHVSPGEKLNPWIGFGLGYEIMTVNVSGGGKEASVSAKGFEFVNLQGGLDFAAVRGVGIGPFFSFSVGQYDTVATDDGTSSDSDDIPSGERAMHEWIIFGLRSAFKL
jgi:hypothetical protein